MNYKFFLLFLLPCLFTACGKDDEFVPENSSIEYAWHQELTGGLVRSIKPIVTEDYVIMSDQNLDFEKQQIFFINKETGKMEGTWDELKNYASHLDGGLYYYDNVLVVNIGGHVFGVDVNTRETLWISEIPNIGDFRIFGHEENIFHVQNDDNGDKAVFHRTVYESDWEKLIVFPRREDFSYWIQNFVFEKNSANETLFYCMEKTFSAALDSAEHIIHAYNFTQDSLVYSAHFPNTEDPGEPSSRPMSIGGNKIIATRGKKLFAFDKSNGELKWEQNFVSYPGSVTPIVDDIRIYAIFGDVINKAFYVVDLHTGNILVEDYVQNRGVDDLVSHDNRVYYTDRKELVIRDGLTGAILEQIKAPFVEDDSDLYFDGHTTYDAETNSIYTFDWKHLIRYNLP